MACGCGKKRTLKSYKPKKLGAKRSSTGTMTCPSCNWPMAKTHYYNQQKKQNSITWKCINRNCKTRRR